MHMNVARHQAGCLMSLDQGQHHQEDVLNVEGLTITNGSVL